MASKKNYVLIHFDNKTLKKNYDTATSAKWDYPDANLIELFNYSGIRLASIKPFH